jgi:hypothetical protein
MPRNISIIITTVNKINFINLDVNLGTLIFINKKTSIPVYQTINVTDLDVIQRLLKKYLITDIVVLSSKDKFNPYALYESLKYAYENNVHIDLTILVPYLTPPDYSNRNDGKVQSFLVSAEILNSFLNSVSFKNFGKLAYDITYKYLNSTLSNNIEVIQVGKPIKNDSANNKIIKQLKQSLAVIPHKGSLKLLNRCLLNLNSSKLLPGIINLCFDDMSYKKIKLGNYSNLQNILNIYKNEPANAGPYLPRHYSICETDKEYIFFLDSDDIAVKSRFCKQLRELKSRNLDMIGSHELRVDQIRKKLIIVRFASDVNKSLSSFYYHPLLHGTALVTKSAYLKAGGLSTDKRFGYDTQFLMRAHFSMKIGNIDDFLYIRFKRPNSLTTNTNTKIGSDLRRFLLWRWKTDFRFVVANKLRLEESSMGVQKHRFPYTLIKLTDDRSLI